MLVARGGEDEDHVVDGEAEGLVDAGSAVEGARELGARVPRAEAGVERGVAGFLEGAGEGGGPDRDVGFDVVGADGAGWFLFV